MSGEYYIPVRENLSVGKNFCTNNIIILMMINTNPFRALQEIKLNIKRTEGSGQITKTYFTLKTTTIFFINSNIFKVKTAN